jgi:hypothetical protein
MLKLSPIFKKNGAHLVETKDIWKKQGMSTLEIWMFWTCKNIFKFLSSFEYVKFAINGKYSQKNYQNSNY